MKLNSKYINNILISLFLCIKPIAWVIPNSDAPIFFVLILCWALAILNQQLEVMANAHILIHISVGVVVTLFLISFNFVHHPIVKQYLIYFLGFGISAVYFSQLKFDKIRVFRYISLISIPLLYFIYQMDMYGFEGGGIDFGMWMGLSYGSLGLIASLFIYIIYFEEKFNSKLLFISILLLYIWFFLEFGTRGAILGIMYLVLSLLVISDKTYSLKKYVASLIIAGIIIVYFNFNKLVSFTNQSLDIIGINFHALNKIERLSTSGDLDNSRRDLFEIGLQGIYDSPLFGHGIGAYEMENGIYIHNFLFQILYEGGILFLIPFVIVIYKALKFIYIRNFCLEERLFLLFLFISGVFELFFSSTYWKSPIFWFFIYYTIKTIKKYRT